MAINEILGFAYQCCDAPQYLEMGERCAATGQCYDALRPLGAVYWFALPFWLGIAPEWLIVWQYLLLALSSVLAAAVLWRGAVVAATATRDWRSRGLWLALSAASHLCWCYPFGSVALSDMPANLFALIGCWLLLLSRGSHLALLALSGLYLGMACWMRTFFLYPLYGLLLLWLLSGRLRPVAATLALFTSLVPVAWQYTASWQDHGRWSYLHEDWTRHWSGKHLEDPASGYDTVVLQPYRWYSSPCGGTLPPPMKAMQEFDIRSLGCVVLGRLHFYLGSYQSAAYYADPGYNRLAQQGVAMMGSPLSVWQLQGMRLETDVAAILESSTWRAAVEYWLQACLDENNTTVACRLLARGEENGAESFPLRTKRDAEISYMEQKIRLSRDSTYAAAALMSADRPLVVRWQVLDETGAIVASSDAALEPSRFLEPQLTFNVPDNGFYRLRITALDAAGDTLLLVWMPWLNAGSQAALPPQPYPPPEEKIRYWSFVLLLGNLASFTLLAVGLWQSRRDLAATPASVLLYLLLTIGMALVIVPEQRFFILPQVMFWLGGCAALAVRVRRPVARGEGTC